MFKRLNSKKWQRRLARVPWTLILPGGFLLGCLLAYSWAIWQNTQEAADVRQVTLVQQRLQGVVQQAMAAHLPLSHRQNILNALKSQLPDGLTMDSDFRLHFPHAGREVVFVVEEDGQIRVLQWVNFTSVSPPAANTTGIKATAPAALPLNPRTASE